MNGIATYRENAVVTQSRGKIVVLLYEGAIRFLRQAVADIQANRPAEKGRLIQKAIEIIIELSVSLDMESGGEIATNLRALYNFMGEHLTRANLHNDAEAVQEVITLLEELNEGWRAITD